MVGSREGLNPHHELNQSNQPQPALKHSQPRCTARRSPRSWIGFSLADSLCGEPRSRGTRRSMRRTARAAGRARSQACARPGAAPGRRRVGAAFLATHDMAAGHEGRADRPLRRAAGARGRWSGLGQQPAPAGEEVWLVGEWRSSGERPRPLAKAPPARNETSKSRTCGYRLSHSLSDST
jgi:hypothetical protein